MEIEKLLLTACESADIYILGRIDPHSLKRGVMRNWRNNHLTVVFKNDEAAIEQVVDARRQQQSVLAVQSFIGRVAPWLSNGSGDQMNRIFHPCDPASPSCAPAP